MRTHIDKLEGVIENKYAVIVQPDENTYEAARELEDKIEVAVKHHDELVEALKTANGMIKHIGCINSNCISGVLETFHKCQWCCEADSIEAVLKELGGE
jgi:hypothetical protein